MNMKHEFETSDQTALVYVRAVDVADLPVEVQEQVHEEVPGADQLFAVHDAEGQRLALVKDRNLAFTLARENDLEPVAVH
ncbi:hypothetical protein ACMU_15490 [Actibacterium mucosum KCTC 23349]|uniref:DUF1150 domain-containing protein n=1 Tax=Actibacterium mucosum KCTC 23349 TaxID=1454373 RepID=A0A037ZG83_9RHOB|nr:DUF1150 family protein [Actibacterium mucosum]KAJ55158.1 hypothetical protein ACMU_15490 [Actibacterium mucosum KCTC 23349]